MSHRQVFLKLHVSSFCLAALLSLAGCSNSDSEADRVADVPAANGASQSVSGKTAKVELGFYTVMHYDKQQHIAEDLAETVTRAQSENKRILLQVGGEWCGWCKLLSNYMATNQPVGDLLNESFLVMKVTYPSDGSEEFLSDYPKCEGYPHLFVLDSGGELLHSQGTAELEEGRGYNDQRVMDFLNAWKP